MSSPLSLRDSVRLEMILLFELRLLLFFFFLQYCFALGVLVYFVKSHLHWGNFLKAQNPLFLSCYQIFKKDDCVVLPEESDEYVYLTDNLSIRGNFMDKGS